MGPSLNVIRAIATELAYRIFKPLVVVASITSFVLVLGMVLLIMLSAWWWLLAAPVFIAISIVGLLLLFAGVTIYIVSPQPSAMQKEKVSMFVDKIQRLSEVTQTPKVVLLFRAIQDVMVPSKNGYIQTIATDTASLAKDFKELQTSFSRRSL